MMEAATRCEADYAAELEREAADIPRRLARVPGVERVILFGSFLRGRRDEMTDLDFVVVMRTELPFVRRLADVVDQVRPTVAADILVYTPEEFERMRGRGIVRQAVETGRAVYESEPGGGGQEVAGPGEGGPGLD
jgi:predicted nucleotidyltransferase